MAKTREEIKLISKELQELKKSLQEIEKSFESLQKSADKTSDKLKVFSQIQKQSSLAAKAIGGLGAVTAKLAIDFNKSFGMVQTLIGTSTEKAKYFKKELLDLSNSYGVSLKDLSDGFYEVISAFGESAENVKQLEVATKAAKAGGASTVESIKLLSSVTKGYGDISQETMEKVSDLSFQVVKDGQTTFPELASSLGRVAPTASSLGISLEELMAVFSTSTGVIGGASEVSTKFQAALVGMTKPTQELQEIYNQLGIASGDALIQQKGFAGALNTIKKAADKNSQSIDKYFGSVEEGNIALLMTGSQADIFAQKLENMHQATGATNEAFTSLSEGTNAFQIKLEKASTQLQNFGIKIGEELIPRLNESLQGVFAFIEGLSSMDKETVALIVDIGEILLVIGGMTTAVMTAQKAWLALCIATKAQTVATVAQTVAQNALNLAMKINPIGRIIIAATALVAILMKMAKWSGESAIAWSKHNSELGKIEDSLVINTRKNQELSEQIKSLSMQENSSLSSKKKLKESLDELTKKYPRLTEEIIRNGIAHNNLNKIVLLEGEIEALEEKKKKFKELSQIFSQIKDKASGVSLFDFIKDLKETSDDDLFKRTIQSLIKRFDMSTIYSELKEKLGENQAGIFLGLQKQIKEGIYHDIGAFNNILDLFTFQYLGGYQRQSLKLKENLDFIAQKDSKSIDEAIKNKKDDQKRLEDLNSPSAVGSTDSRDLEVDKKKEKEAQKLKAAYELKRKIIKEELIKLKQDLEKAGENVLLFSQMPIEEVFAPIQIGNDPWGLQRIFDLAGQILTKADFQNKLQSSLDSIEKLKRALSKKEGLENTIQQKEGILSELGGEETDEKLKEIEKAFSQTSLQVNKNIAEESKNLSEQATKAMVETTQKLSKGALKQISQRQQELADQIQKNKQELIKMGSQLSGAFATSALTIFQGFSQQEAKNYLNQLDILQRQIDEKMQEYQLNRRAEEERLAEEKRQKEYEQSLQDLDNTIHHLENQFEAEVSAQKRSEIAQQIQEANKQKAKETQRREEEKIEKERQQAEKQQIYEFELQKYQIEVDRVNKENEMAENDKKQKIAQVWIDTATAIATAWASSATPLTFWFGGAFTAVMAGVAAAQTALIASQNVQKPIPSPPKAPKLRQGGIVTNQGLQGKEVIVGDGIDEAILPMEQKTYNMLASPIAQALLEKLARQTAEMQANSREIQTMNIQNTIHMSQNIDVLYNPRSLIASDMPQENLEQIAKIAFQEGVNNINIQSDVENFFMKNSRYAYNAMKDQS